MKKKIKDLTVNEILECAKKFGVGDCTRCPLYSAKYLPCEQICNNTCKALEHIGQSFEEEIELNLEDNENEKFNYDSNNFKPLEYNKEEGE